MEEIFIVFVVLLSSAVAYPIVKRMHAGTVPSITFAARAFLEWVGLFAFLFIFNILVGGALIVVVRNLTPRFVGFYDLENALLLVLSAAEGFVFQRLWKWD